jgi:hypothetical protein
MKLEGSCHCGSVRFSLQSWEPVPYMNCLCSVCRKTMGLGINLGGDLSTMEVQGQEHVRVYRARIQNPEDSEPRQSRHERSFCGECGTHLWAWHPRWPDQVHPVATAIDTPLPAPPERTWIMLDFKPEWLEIQPSPGDQEFRRYPAESLADWHRRHGLGGSGKDGR